MCVWKVEVEGVCGGRGCVCGEREGGTWRERWVVSGAGW